MLSEFFWNSFLRWVSKFLIFAMTKFLLNAIFLMSNAFDAVFESLSIDFDWKAPGCGSASDSLPKIIPNFCHFKLQTRFESWVENFLAIKLLFLLQSFLITFGVDSNDERKFIFELWAFPIIPPRLQVLAIINKALIIKTSRAIPPSLRGNV